MGEVLPDGTIGGYSNSCPICKKTIRVNMQGDEIGKHECIDPDEARKLAKQNES